jgi:hypothetical protein
MHRRFTTFTSAVLGGVLVAACGGAPETPAKPAPAAPAAPAEPPTPAPAPAEPAVPAGPPLTDAERASAPGRIFYLAEREGGATIDAILPSGQGAKTMLQGTASHGPPSVLPGPVAPGGELMAVITVDEHEGAHFERIEVRPLGEAGELGEPLWRSDAAPQVRSPAWSPDGRTLAFEAAFSSFRDIYALDLSERAKPKLNRLTDHPAGNYEPAWSPDGRQIAFVSSRDGIAEIYVMRADGSNQQRLTNVWGYDGGPFFTQDGKKIVWRRFDEQGLIADVWTMNPDGSDQKQITDFASMSWAPYMHPSGQYILFASNKLGFENFEVFMVDAQGEQEPVRVTYSDGFDGLPVPSPDGKTLAFTSSRSGGSAGQLFLAQWNHEKALEALKNAPPKKPSKKS